jgi:hypothetical protein
MAATIVVIRDEKKWEVVEELLGDLEEGGIIVPPEEVERLDENFPGWEDHLEKYMEYDFGGDPNVLVDVARNDNFAAMTLDDFLIEAQRQQEAK